MKEEEGEEGRKGLRKLLDESKACLLMLIIPETLNTRERAIVHATVVLFPPLSPNEAFVV